jgi:hypothetical protein
MDVHFNDTRAANASAAKLWEVVTDYASYPTFNAAIINVRVADLLAWLRLFLCGRLWNYADPFVSEPLRYLLRYLVSVNGHVHRHLRSGLRRWLRRKEPQQGVDDHQQQHVIRRDPHIVWQSPSASARCGYRADVSRSPPARGSAPALPRLPR